MTDPASADVKVLEKVARELALFHGGCVLTSSGGESETVATRRLGIGPTGWRDHVRDYVDKYWTEYKTAAEVQLSVRTTLQSRLALAEAERDQLLDNHKRLCAAYWSWDRLIQSKTPHGSQHREIFESYVDGDREAERDVTLYGDWMREKARAEIAEAQSSILVEALKTLLGTSEHGQGMEWSARIKQARDAVENPSTAAQALLAERDGWKHSAETALARVVELEHERDQLKATQRFRDEGDAARKLWDFIDGIKAGPLPAPAAVQVRELRGRMGSGPSSDDKTVSLWINDRLWATCSIFRDISNFTVLTISDYRPRSKPGQKREGG